MAIRIVKSYEFARTLPESYIRKTDLAIEKALHFDQNLAETSKKSQQLLLLLINRSWKPDKLPIGIYVLTMLIFHP